MRKITNTHRIILIILAMALFSCWVLPSGQAVPPVTTTQQIQEGYIISDTPQNVLKQNANFTYNFFLYNLSKNVLLDNSSINCTFYLSNSSGTVIFDESPNYFLSDGHWSLFILGSNFSNSGDYFYGTKCQSEKLGGAITGKWTVNVDGIELTTSRAFINIILLLLLVIFLSISIAIFIKYDDNLLVKIGMFGLSYLLLIAITFISWNMAINFLTSSPFLVDMFKILFWVLIVGLFPLIIGAFAYYIIMLGKIKEIENLMKHGFSRDEAQDRIRRRKK